MGVRPAQAVAVSTSPVILAGSQPSKSTAIVANTGSATIYLGDSTVTAATGFPLPATDSLSFDLGVAEVLYGICASATSSTMAVLELGL